MRAIAALVAAMAFSSCASHNPLTSQGPEPRVENCMLLQQATPTRFVCDGKIYTAVELTGIRKGAGAAGSN